MRNESVEELRKIAARIGDFMGSTSAECALAPGNGSDESMLLGTADSFLRLAKTLIEIVCIAQNEKEWAAADFDREVLCGQPTVATNAIKYAFDELAPIWPMAAYLVASDAERKLILERLGPPTQK